MPTVIHHKKAVVPKVEFASSPVTSIMRPLNNTEAWAMYDFETHAQVCRKCCNPYEVHRSGNKLCETGQKLAQEVSRYLYSEQDGTTYSYTGKDNKLVRIEMPADYVQTRGLLRAIERSLRRRKDPFVSQGRTYQIDEREPRLERSCSVKLDQISKLSRRTTEIVDWPTTERSTVVQVSKSKRGSLYESDIAEQRRAYPKYKVEVREPTRRDILENRRSGYYV
ncbi:hypothetical protein M501DRAFT_1018018 [Patellaria atrata CBS 101060]|uniref:Uncharacterized protein n=1 Tax=Patellaria atrata CBS 101060 TaxID=1346257 RepID=A0A9P4VLK3_9PEZI|nr:hypothetical protein M501DRAFT_1018018 [Patellaria atrata CBS 101060]